MMTTIDKGQLYLFDPKTSAQGFLLCTTGKYGAGSELMAQQLFSLIIREGDVVVDVGAHFGFYTLIAAVRVGPKGFVFSFKPSSFNFRVLKLNILLNKLKNVRIFKVALSDKGGRACLGIPKGRMSGEDTLAIEPTQAERGEYVKMKRFDEIARQLSINKIDVVKVDVEGAEYLVLKGFDRYLDKCKHIILEVHPEKMIKLRSNPRSLYQLLEERGFSLYLLDSKHGIMPMKFLKPEILKLRHHLLATRSLRRELNKIKFRLIEYSLTSPYSLKQKM